MWVTIVPNGRDYKAKFMYKFYSWFLRKNRKEIEKQARDTALNYILYGQSANSAENNKQEHTKLGGKE